MIAELSFATVAASAIAWGIYQRRLRIHDQQMHADQTSERRQGEKLREKELSSIQKQKLQTETVLDRLQSGVLLCGAKGKLLLYNPAAISMLGLEPNASYIGRPLSEIVRIPSLTKAVADTSSEHSLFLEMTTTSVTRPITADVIPFDVPNGTNVLVTLYDQTEARRVDEMRREFTANVSHELKTPLAAIKGYAETVGTAIDDDPDAAKLFISRINRECLRLEQLVAGMMQLARAQSGSQNLRIQNLPLRDVLEQSLHSNRPIATARGVKLTVDPLSDSQVMADAEATLTIVNNLIGNALKYTPDGGQVRVGFESSGNFVAVYVEDTGIGISEKDQMHVFDRFYRVETKRQIRDSSDNDPQGDPQDDRNAQPSPVSGAGIGLSIVKNLTQAMGGEVRLSSRPDKGSRFEVLLPAMKDQNSDDADSSSPS